MASVTIDTIIERMEQLNASFVNGDLVSLAIEPSAKELLIAIKKRVVGEGKGSDGQQLKSYSRKPFYAQQSQFIKGGFNPQGKYNLYGNTIGDVLVPTITLKRSRIKSERTRQTRYTLVKPNYKPRKTMYLQEGYKELRDIQGLRTDITNMSYSGVMVSDYLMQRDGENVVLGMASKESANKYLGNTFGTSKKAGRGLFFQASDSELAKFNEKATFRLRRLTNGILLDGETITSIAQQNESTI